MQVDFVDKEKGKLWLPDNLRILPKLKKLIKTCRELKVPVIYTAHQHSATGRDKGFMWDYFDLYKRGALMEGSPGSEIYPEIAPTATEPVIKTKHRYDAFYGTDLDIILRNLGVDTVIISGCMTNYCCDSTARSAFMMDYKVVFGSDINATDDPVIHESTLKTMRRGFARVMSCDEIIKALKERK